VLGISPHHDIDRQEQQREKLTVQIAAAFRERNFGKQLFIAVTQQSGYKFGQSIRGSVPQQLHHGFDV
jgi:hypothetical protein